MLEDEAQVRRDRIVAQHRVAGLLEIAQAQSGQRAEQHRHDCEQPVQPRRRPALDQRDEEERQQDGEREDDETRRERQSERLQVPLPFPIRTSCCTPLV